MIMPYGRKATQAEPGRGPAEIDFNALWDRAYVPTIKALGYEPVRADQDTGALIVSQMLERLYFADLVLADMTIPNGNVYYEVGIRHASQKTGCVLLAAEWSKQLFDVVQMRTIRYPLADGNIPDATAAAVQAAIRDDIRSLCAGISPMHQSIPGYPMNVDPRKASTMRDQLAELAAFQTKVRAVRAAPAADRMRQALDLIATEGRPPATYSIALALLLLIRDCVVTLSDWSLVVEYARGLPEHFANEPEVLEIRAFAAAQGGNSVQSIAELQTLIDLTGPTPERLGLMGGRYKRLAKVEAATESERRQALAKAIECYERGMELDLNAYYCSSNLPRMYRARARAGDEERAQTALRLAIAACERAKRLNVADEWLRPTLLAAAFDLGDPDKAEELADEVIAEGQAAWKVQSVLLDLETSVLHVDDIAKRSRLYAIIERIRIA
ncbi:tetratricopeptide repeat-containing protein [Bradyrhizobium sp. DASA03076]|uniref:tetratricopeptide repeat-containing protein n=1 Tax=Bradyrhizobium sp. BLXBL-03 TaxID=3395916 RepID=UPI003F72BC94